MAGWNRERNSESISTGAPGAGMRWALAVLGVVAVLGTLAWFGQRSLIFFPDRSDPGAAQEMLEHGSDVTLTTADGLELSAWRLDPTGADRGTAVLYLPGNAGNRAGRADVGQALAAEGFTVLLVDYRGYGGNPGRPSENGLALDAQAGLAYLNSVGVPAEDTIVVGESIGTGVAVRLAAHEPVAGVLLRSPYTSLAAVARSAYGVPLGWLLRDEFDTMSWLPSVTSPVMVLFGAADEIIPPAQSTEVARATPNLHAVLEVPGTGHNDPIWFGPFLAEQVAALADSAG